MLSFCQLQILLAQLKAQVKTYLNSLDVKLVRFSFLLLIFHFVGVNGGVSFFIFVVFMLQIEIPWNPDNTDASPSKIYAIRSSTLSGCTCDETGSQKKTRGHMFYRLRLPRTF